MATRRSLKIAKATIVETHRNAMRLLCLLDTPLTHLRINQVALGPKPFVLGDVKPGGWGVFGEDDLKDPPRLQYYAVKLPTPSANAIDFHLLHERLEGKEYPKPLPMLQQIAI